MRDVRPPDVGEKMLDTWTHGDTIEAARFGWEVLAGIAVVVVGVMNRSLRSALRMMATKAELAEHKEDHDKDHKLLERRLAEGDVRFKYIETTLHHMPTRKDIDDLNANLAKILAEMTGIKSEVKTLAVQVHQLVQNELEHRT